jgi:hypothetical protein
MKLTENQVIDILCQYLKKEGWAIESTAPNHDKGEDIIAIKDNKMLVVEAKGARGNPESKVTTRAKFDKGQIKISFGAAIVKTLSDMLKPEYENALFAIAFPDDVDVRNAVGALIPFLKKLDIIYFWVGADDQIIRVD